MKYQWRNVDCVTEKGSLRLPFFSFSATCPYDGPRFRRKPSDLIFNQISDDEQYFIKPYGNSLQHKKHFGNPDRNRRPIDNL